MGRTQRRELQRARGQIESNATQSDAAPRVHGAPCDGSLERRNKNTHRNQAAQNSRRVWLRFRDLPLQVRRGIRGFEGLHLPIYRRPTRRERSGVVDDEKRILRSSAIRVAISATIMRVRAIFVTSCCVRNLLDLGTSAISQVLSRPNSQKQSVNLSYFGHRPCRRRGCEEIPVESSCAQLSQREILYDYKY